MNDQLFYHAIATATHGGYASIKKYREAGDWEAAYDTLKATGASLPDPHDAYEQLGRSGIRVVLAGQREYPEALRHIPHPPFGIYLRGEAMPSDAPLPLAIVGTRRASPEGKRTARHFARELTAAGCTIASGLAFGIDAAAHEGCLDAGGATVAILAGGLNAIYPHSHDALARRIMEGGGTLISEYPPGEEPFGYRFIERNRIVSGISRGVLIVEAPESSGALATARYAVEQDREVFVVPGAIGAENFKGSHALIRQGAELVTTPDDILNAYDINKKGYIAARANAASPEETLIIKALASIPSPADVDKLIAMTKLEPRIVSRTLSFLLLRGIVKETEEGYTI
jgi:DNA processing protein